MTNADAVGTPANFIAPLASLRRSLLDYSEALSDLVVKHRCTERDFNKKIKTAPRAFRSGRDALKSFKLHVISRGTDAILGDLEPGRLLQQCDILEKRNPAMFTLGLATHAGLALRVSVRDHWLAEVITILNLDAMKLPGALADFENSEKKKHYIELWTTVVTAVLAVVGVGFGIKSLWLAVMFGAVGLALCSLDQRRQRRLAV